MNNLNYQISNVNFLLQSGEGESSLAERIDQSFGGIVEKMAEFLFYPIADIPVIVWVLMLGAIFFTIYHSFINFRGFKHSLDVVKGKYDDPNHPGEISHFQALTSALSATVGLGNIAGVAVAVGVGGPGAVFWMIILGLFGMTSKFHECTLAQFYRKVDKDGTVHGGPMYYLSLGLKERGLGALGKILAIVFAVFCIGGSFGGGNMFQANQTFEAMSGVIPSIAESPWGFGFFMTFLVGLVIIGGIKRIGKVTEKIIPFMCGLYLSAGLIVLFKNANQVLPALNLIFTQAFNPDAAYGGLIGVMVQGIRRAVFSNEAGIGSAAIAHSAAKTDQPVREGIVGMIGPFIDTVVICTMTALILIVSGVYNVEGLEGVSMTKAAFESTFSWFPAVLSVCVFFFAYSTMISWSYYGEKAWAYLFGMSSQTTLIYRLIFLAFVVLGTVMKLGNVLDFSDLMILSMAFPNIIGGILLAPKVKTALSEYWSKLMAGKFKVYK